MAYYIDRDALFSYLIKSTGFRTNCADILAEKQARMRAIDKAAEDGMVELRANAHTQRAMWLMVCSVADAYGFGPERMKLFLETLQSNAEELQRMIDDVDEDYAYEKMRRKAEQVTGEKLEYYIDVELKKSRERMI